MAFDAQGWRKLVVGERVFYWRDWRANFDALFVRPEVEPYRLLRVTENRCQCGPHSGWAATPGTARAAVDCALEHDWLTTQPALRVCAFSDPARCAGIRHEWVTSTVIALVHGIRERNAFDAMPILADALQDAGCENEDILDHCRAAGSHVGGCWVLDLILRQVVSAP